MFGTNPLRKQELGDGSSLVVHSIFPTLQGEGPFAGMPAIFVRLWGCNLRCHFCDTDFEYRRAELPLDRLILAVRGHDPDYPYFPYEGNGAQLVVITGGEPFRQNLVRFVDNVVDEGYQVQIETAGTLWNKDFEGLIEEEGVTLVCSPKTGKVHPMIEKYCYHWKYLIDARETDPTDGLPNMSTQVQGERVKIARPPKRDGVTVWLQPCERYFLVNEPKERTSEDARDQEITNMVRDEELTWRNIKHCVDVAMQFDYRLSLQTHKLLGLP